MGLSQSIVVVNKFSSKTTAGGPQSKTPGKYITQYMARDNAVEPVAPITATNNSVENFVQRYMARDSAVDVSVGFDQAHQGVKGAAKSGGVAFGYGHVSLSHEDMVLASKDIQRLSEGRYGSDGSVIEEPKTVMMTVLSFDEKYLRDNGIIPEDFVHEERGDYRGKLDQTKLRLAIMKGLDKMKFKGFDDLRYVGVIQVDTDHVHCHLAMVDAGVGRRTKDGQQKGKLSSREMNFLRRGVDQWLDDNKTVKFLSSAVQYEQQNIATYMKKWTHQRVAAQALPQVLIASLPEDRRLWRASTNRESMRRPQELVRALVDDVLSSDDSPYQNALNAVSEYAQGRQEREGLSEGETEKLIVEGQRRIRESATNAVYDVLSSVPQQSLNTRTKPLELASLDENALARKASENPDDDLALFAHRFRAFTKRKKKHEKERDEALAQIQDFDAAEDVGLVTADAIAIRRFYEVEAEYHDMVASKYQHLSTLTYDRDEAMRKISSLQDYKSSLDDLKMMRSDRSLNRMRDGDKAERIGLEIYGQYGAKHLTEGSKGRSIIDRRIRNMEDSYEEQRSTVIRELSDQKLQLTEDFTVVEGTKYDFAQTRGLDLHRMKLDSREDSKVAESVKRDYVQWAQRRALAMREAVRYLNNTDQKDLISTLPISDIRSMATTAAQVRGTGVLKSELNTVLSHDAQPQMVTVSSTSRLDTTFRSRVNLAVTRAENEYVGRRFAEREEPVVERAFEPATALYTPRHASVEKNVELGE